MKLKHYPSQNLKKEILEIVGQYLNLNTYKVFFFGSRIAGKQSERSDIDIGIKGPQEVPLEAMAKIKEEISNLGLLYPIDVVDFYNAHEDFQRVAKQDIELINQ